MVLKEVEKPFNDDNYLYELKFDGIRALLYVSKDTFQLITRNGNDVSSIYPELRSIQKIVGKREVIFDGELVAFSNGNPSFSSLGKRSHLKNTSKIEDMIEDVPVTYVVFDILYQDKDITSLSLVKRKELLNEYPDTDVFVKSVIYQDGIHLFSAVQKKGLEGIVAKLKNSIYIPGARVDSWLKIKNFKHEEFFIHGYLKMKEKYSLLLGEYRNQKLYYVGKVSITEKNPILEKLLNSLESKNIFENYQRAANYIKPIHKINVQYMERTLDNYLRQPFVSNKKA